jgi:type I restriction enzyme S subunit
MKTLIVNSKQMKAAGRWDIDYHLPPVGITAFSKDILAPVRNCADVVKTGSSTFLVGKRIERGRKMG